MSASQSKNGLVLAAKRCSVGELECECDSDMFQVLKAGADGGDPKVIYQLGKYYHYGWGTAKDLKAAVECYARAAGLGSYEALWRLWDLRNDQSVRIDLQNAFRGFCEKAEQVYARAQFNAGYCHYWGVGTPEDKAKARDLFQKAADQGCADAMWRLDVCRQNRVGDGCNGMNGIELLKYAAELGSAEAQNELGYAYYWGETTYGPEVEKDRKQAVEWWQKATDQNHTGATYRLAWRYCDGEGVQKDVEKAFQLDKKAALMGNREAQDVISNFYRHKIYGLSENDYPVGIDYYEAAYWNRKAVDQEYDLFKVSIPDVLKAIGLTQDQIDELMNQASSFESAKTWYDIAKQYETGDSVEKDEQKALEMYRLAARFGSTEGQVALARCYEQGIGADVDLSQAIHWYEKAVKYGNIEAAKSLLKIILPESAAMALKEGSPFAALAECYQTGSGVLRNEDAALLMREHAAANGDIQQAKIVIEAYMSGNGNEYRIKFVGSIVAMLSGLSREDQQQFIDKFQNRIDELDKMQILQHMATAIRAESMGINIIFE